MNNKIVESRNYLYLIMLILQISVFYLAANFSHNKLQVLESEITEKYKYELSDSFLKMKIGSAKSNLERAIFWGYLLVFITYFFWSIYLASHSKNIFKINALLFWIFLGFLPFVNTIINGEESIMDEWTSIITAHLLFLYLSGPLMILTYFESIIGKRILQSEYTIKQHISSTRLKFKDLRELLQNGIISPQEYDDKSKFLKNELIQIKVENNIELLELKSKLDKAVNSGLVGRDVADAKIKELKINLLNKFKKNEK